MFDIKFNALDYAPKQIAHQVDVREKAWGFVEKNSLPKKTEIWKYTDLSKVILPNKNFVKPRKEQDFDREKILSLKDNNNIYLVFIDGNLDECSSDIDDVFDAGAYIKSILGQAEDVSYGKDNYMLALNDATHTDGIHLSIGGQTKLSKPIIFLYVSTGNSNGDIHNYKNVIQVEYQSEVKVIEKYLNLSNLAESNPVYNMQIQCRLDDSAVLSYDMPSSHSQNNLSLIHSIETEQNKCSQFNYTNLALTDQFCRFDVIAKLNGNGSEAIICGATIVSEQGHADHHIYVEHNADNTSSDVKYRMVATDYSSAIFNAKALVGKLVKGIKAHQSNKNILLSNTAEINTKPELEIYADDVVCSHGATIGQLDEDAIYYVMSRGISEANAKKLLLESFMADAIADGNSHKAEYHSDVDDMLNKIL